MVCSFSISNICIISIELELGLSVGMVVIEHWPNASSNTCGSRYKVTKLDFSFGVMTISTNVGDVNRAADQASGALVEIVYIWRLAHNFVHFLSLNLRIFVCVVLSVFSVLNAIFAVRWYLNGFLNGFLNGLPGAMALGLCVDDVYGGA